MKQANINIRIYPTLDTKHLARNGAEITIGDLHGNALKLFYMLVRHGVMSISSEEYNKFVNLYGHSKNLTAQDITQFEDILAKAKFDTTGFVRLVGDNFADRGGDEEEGNDTLTLGLFEAMKRNGVNFENIFSNHDLEFMCGYEIANKHFDPTIILMFNQGATMGGLKKLITDGIVTEAAILQKIDYCFKPTLKLLSYSLTKDKKDITLFTHAPVGFEHIEILAKKFKVKYNDSTALALGITIDKINQAFQKQVDTNQVSKYFDFEKIMDTDGKINPKDEPVFYTAWNRTVSNNKRPHIHRGYKVRYVHGHTISSNDPEHIINLDNSLGKFPGTHVGEYHVLYTPSTPIPAIQPNAPIARNVSAENNSIVSLLTMPLRHSLAASFFLGISTAITLFMLSFSSTIILFSSLILMAGSFTVLSLLGSYFLPPTTTHILPSQRLNQNPTDNINEATRTSLHAHRHSSASNDSQVVTSNQRRLVTSTKMKP